MAPKRGIYGRWRISMKTPLYVYRKEWSLLVSMAKLDRKKKRYIGKQYSKQTLLSGPSNQRNFGLWVL
jgi:hypothetical protein